MPSMSALTGIVRNLAWPSTGSWSYAIALIWNPGNSPPVPSICVWQPHDLRRTCARLCHASGGELEQIQFLLGHVSVQTTERYLGGKQRIRSAVNDRIGIEPKPTAHEVSQPGRARFERLSDIAVSDMRSLRGHFQRGTSFLCQRQAGSLPQRPSAISLRPDTRATYFREALQYLRIIIPACRCSASDTAAESPNATAAASPPTANASRR